MLNIDYIIGGSCLLGWIVITLDCILQMNKENPQKPNPKMFTCECGYLGIRWNENIICKCGKEGKLTELTKDSKNVLEW